jgi:hypothetical protein
VSAVPGSPLDPAWTLTVDALLTGKLAQLQTLGKATTLKASPV